MMISEILLEELYKFAINIYEQEREPISRARLTQFLATKIPADKIEEVLLQASLGELIKRT